MAPLVYIVLVNWNGYPHTAECLRSLEGVTYPRLEAVVVDNGSTDDSVTRLREEWSGIRLLECENNLGFAGGSNRGIRYALEARANYVLLLNNDTVAEPTFLSAMTEVAATSQDIGMVGAVISHYRQPDRIWYAGGRWNPAVAAFNHVMEVPDPTVPAVSTDFVTGCALLTSDNLLREVGLLDERFFHMWEDVDLCYRARRVGYQSVIATNAHIQHKVGATIGGKSPLYWYYFVRNNLLWLERNRDLLPQKHVTRRTLRRIWHTFRQVRLPERHDRMQRRFAILQGVRDYALRRFGPRR